MAAVPGDRSSTVRSVRVKLDADVAAYIAKMKLAGAATDAAFGGDRTKQVKVYEDELDKLKTKTNAIPPPFQKAERELDVFHQKMRSGGPDIDKYSGRLGILVKSIVTLGPALVPIAAETVPILSALTLGLGAVAGAATTLVFAFSGLGDVTTALNAYDLAPTAENLQKVQLAAAQAGPVMTQFATYLEGIKPEFKGIQQVAQEGLFPGIETSINRLLPLLPRIQTMVAGISNELGALSVDAAQGIAGNGGVGKFVRYLEANAVPTLHAFATATGDFLSGLFTLVTDLDPLTQLFLSGMVNSAKGFQAWADGLANSQGFYDFLDYVRTNGPKVSALLGALGDDVSALLHALAPWGAVIVPILTDIARVFSLIANSPIGPVIFSAIAALVAANTVVGLGSKAWEKLGVSAASASATGVTSSEALAVAEAEVAAATDAVTAAQLRLKAAFLTNDMTGAAAAADALAAANGRLAAAESAAGAAAGTMTKLGLGLTGLAAFFGTKEIGSFFDQLDDKKIASETSSVAKLTKNMDDLAGSAKRLADPSIGNRIGNVWAKLLGTGAGNTDATKQIKALDQQLASLINSGNAQQAYGLFDQFAVAAGQLGVSTDDAKKELPAYESALKQTGLAQEAAKTSTERLTDAFSDQILKQNQLHDATLQGNDAYASWGSAMQNATQAAKDNAHKGIDVLTAAGLANYQAINQAIEAWNGMTYAQQQAQGGAQGMTGKLQALMKQMGLTAAQQQELLAQVNTPIKPTVDSSQLVTAYQYASGLAAELNSVNGKKYAFTISGTTVGVHLPSGGTALYADGGTVGGAPRYPYGDKVLIGAAPGEEIISNRHGEADRFRYLRAQGMLPGFADGGTIGRAMAAPSRGIGGSSGAGGMSAAEAQKQTRLLAATVDRLAAIEEHTGVTAAKTPSSDDIANATQKVTAASNR